MTYLPGSCIAAGYTSCCTTATSSNNCAGEPATCFCDPSCNEFGDCCEDLQQICNPEWGELMFMYVPCACTDIILLRTMYCVGWEKLVGGEERGKERRVN